MPMDETPTDSLIELESQVMHLQNDLKQMNNVILDQQREIESLNQRIQQLESRLEETGEGPENRDPLEERPPHY
jgi:SlyX protein